MSCEDHHYYPCSYPPMLSRSNDKLWTIVGEFSLATPKPCGGQDFFASQQIAAFEKSGSGWFMWAHDHAQNWQEWSYKKAYENHWIDPNGPKHLQC